ncbi:hypothetical protein BX616_006229, partial [Lobosporangium transversale]
MVASFLAGSLHCCASAQSTYTPSDSWHTSTTHPTASLSHQGNRLTDRRINNALQVPTAAETRLNQYHQQHQHRHRHHRLHRQQQKAPTSTSTDSSSHSLMTAHDDNDKHLLTIMKHSKPPLPERILRLQKRQTHSTPVHMKHLPSPSSPSSSLPPSSPLPSLLPTSSPSAPQPLIAILPLPSQGSSSGPDPSSTASQPQKPISLISSQNGANASQINFPYTPATGARNELTLTPNVTSDSFNGRDPENSGASQAIFSTVSLLQANGGVSAVIGDVSSALSMQSALLTSRLSIPQCSYSAGSTQLSNKDDYDYFFRTIPTELMFGKVMIDFVASRGWKTIAVLYTGDSLGVGIMDNIVLQAAQKNITVGFKQAFWESGTSLDIDATLNSVKESGQRIILVAAVNEPQIRLMIEAVNKGLVSKNYVWLTINQIAEPMLEENSGLKPSDLNGLFMFDNLLKLNGYEPYERFLDKWAALDPS